MKTISDVRKDMQMKYVQILDECNPEQVYNDITFLELRSCWPNSITPMWAQRLSSYYECDSKSTFIKYRVWKYLALHYKSEMEKTE